jgi:hypothetical protein
VGLVVVAAAGALALAAGSPAAAADDSWGEAATRVDFPLYRPTVTLGFTPGPVVVTRCGDSGSTWVQASYRKGSALFGFDESYPQHCGDAGDRQKVASAEVMGSTVDVEAYCYPRPKCTLQDGFDNGFHIELLGAGPKRTMIGVYSRGVTLPDLLRMVRSLKRVPRTVTAAPPGQGAGVAAAGPCSKAEARRVVERLRLGSTGDPNLSSPVFQVLCGPFVGPGSQAMVASLAIPSCGRTAGWVVFRRAGTSWELVLQRNNGADLDVVGTGIRETQFVLRPGDARCFPTGGTRSRVWRWNGSRFTSGAWKQSTPAKPPPANVTLPTGYFKTPSGNIVCAYWLRSRPPSIGCRIKSGLVPKPRTDRPGCPRTHEVDLRATGRPRIGGRSICPGEPEGDAGVLAYEAVARVLDYGTTWTGGGIRCTSESTGLTCRNGEGHGFFLSRERWRSF